MTDTERPERTETWTRRRLVTTGSALVAGLSGCLSEGSSTPAPRTETDGETESGESPRSDSPTLDDQTTATATSSQVTVASVSVGDYFLYPLAGVHPHVHNEVDTQFLSVGFQTSDDRRRLRDRVELGLDGESVPLARRRPVGGEADVTLAFAVPKGPEYERGGLSVDGTRRRALDSGTLESLRRPPVFEVATPTLSPDEIESGANREPTVQFDVRNTGPGDGEFAASLKGNAVSGSRTVAGTVDAGASRRFEAATRVLGEGDSVTVRLDWGVDEWTGSITVVDS